MRTALLFLFISILGFSQNYKITYQTSFEGKTRPQDPVVVFANPNENYILTESILKKEKQVPFEVIKNISKESKTIYFGFLAHQEIAATETDKALKSYTYQLKDDTKKILGYVCKKAITSVNSNTIEIWYTNQLNLFAGPNLMGQNLGLVLEVTRNGSTTTKATELKKVKSMDFSTLFNTEKAKFTDGLSYKDLLWKSKFETLSVFNQATINFSGESKSDEIIKRFANGTVILKKIKFPEIASGSQIFVQLNEQSKGDAYDRTGTVFAVPQDRTMSFLDALEKGIKTVPAYENGNGKKYYGVEITKDYLPALELMRFFTPFGVKQFNHIQLKGKNWEEKANYRQDISELSPSLSGKELWIGAFIGNYDKGGHQIDLEITIHKNDGEVFKNNFNLPLFNTLNIMEMAGQDYSTMFNNDKGLEIDFDLNEDLENATLRYLSTGHGGWGNGDEFVPKVNSVYIDGQLVHSFIPWRSECGSYRLYNPASGNFENGLSSSDLSRSNWCPGTVTNPNFIPLGNLKSGKHRIKISIPQGENEGSSFSSWNVSGTLLGTVKK